jgi:hypothetical protein
MVQLEKSILNSTKELEGKEDVDMCQWINTFLADISISAVLPLPKDTFVHIKDRIISDLLCESHLFHLVGAVYNDDLYYH